MSQRVNVNINYLSLFTSMVRYIHLTFQTIKAIDIATVRKLSKPPYLIMLIMDCVLILFGRKLEPVKPDYEHQFLTASWSEALKVTLCILKRIF